MLGDPAVAAPAGNTHSDSVIAAAKTIANSFFIGISPLSTNLKPIISPGGEMASAYALALFLHGFV